MYYTLIGAVVGGLLAYVGCKVFNVNDKPAGWAMFPTQQAVYVIIGILVGGGVGAGLGISAIANGRHLVNRLIR